MVYANTVNKILFILTLFLSLIFSWDYKTSNAETTTPTQTLSWLQAKPVHEALSWATQDRKKNSHENKSANTPRSICDKQCKKDSLVKIGIKKEFAESLVEICKELAENPVHCIRVGSSILVAESGWWYRCREYNCMGIGKGTIPYMDYNDSIRAWVKKYVKYWYKAPSMTFFYPPAGQKSKSRYCTSEESSWSSIGCPNWLKHATVTWNSITF